MFWMQQWVWNTQIMAQSQNGLMGVAWKNMNLFSLLHDFSDHFNRFRTQIRMSVKPHYQQNLSV